MLSPYIYAGIACAVFLFIFSARIKSGKPDYSLGELAVFYLLIRIVPVMMYQHHGMMNYIALAEDIVILAAVYLCAGKQLGQKSARTAAALYLFNPLTAACVITGHKGTMLLVPAAYIAVYCAVIFLRRKKLLSEIRRFFPCYIWICAGGYMMLLADDCLGQDFADVLSETEFPTVFVLGAAVTVIGAVLAVRKLAAASSIEAEASFDEATAAAEECAAHTDSHEDAALPPAVSGKWSARNTIAAAALTVVYAAVALLNLGVTSVPSSGMHFSAEEGAVSEVVIDLGEYTTLSEVRVFLGRESKRMVSLSAYNEVTREWVMMVSQHEMKSPYQWNSIPVNWKLRYLGIVFHDNSADVLEIALIGKDGELLSPVSAADYPALFDEQELFPEYDTYRYRMMFDEVYHGRTAYEFLNDLPIYENTHPPLGKTIISAGIAAFGMNPFGWRIMCVVFGTLMVPLAYAFAWRLSRRSDAAFLGGFLMATEFMHFTLSRIATIDIIVGCFILMMFFFMFLYIDDTKNGAGTLRRYAMLLLCGISMGLACATKWTGLYASMGIAVLFFVFLIKDCAGRERSKALLKYLLRLFAVCAVCFVAVPCVIYVGSYFEFAQVYTDKNMLEHAISNAKHMLSYHTATVFDHPYSSEWYEWIVDRRSLLDAFNLTAGNGASCVATLASPLIAWGGIAALLHNMYLWRIEGNEKSQYLILAYISMLMPWFFVHRTVFIYQYFICVVILILMIVNSVISLKAVRKWVIGLAASSGALFLMFYPVISGLSVWRAYIAKVLEWLTTWRFE